jgi:uncharacterized protein (TIGR02996 family)
MKEHEPSLRAVLADPEHTGPRLVYADWFEEHGELDRADLIRTMCQLAHVETPTTLTPDGSEQYRRLYFRIWSLLKLAQAADCLIRDWAGFRGDARPIGYTGGWERGFMRTIMMDFRDWMRHGVEIVRRQPIREVRLLLVDIPFKEARIRLCRTAPQVKLWYLSNTVYPEVEGCIALTPFREPTEETVTFNLTVHEAPLTLLPDPAGPGHPTS